MAVLEFSEIQTRRHELRHDAEATSATKDAVAHSFHGKFVSAVGTVADVIGRDGDLIVLFIVDGEILSCPLQKTRGPAMDETIEEVASWRKTDRVCVSGKLSWPDFQSDIGIGIATAEKSNGDAASS